MGKLDGKVVIVTGAGRGIGRGIALTMAKEGASLVLNSVDPEKRSAEKVAEEIRAAGGKAVARELYDHQNDPQENINLANRPEHEKLVGRLSRQLKAGWKAERGRGRAEGGISVPSRYIRRPPSALHRPPSTVGQVRGGRVTRD